MCGGGVDRDLQDALVTAILGAISLSTVMLLIDRMERLLADTRDLALKDPLTGLLNRRAFKEMADRVFDRAKREDRPVVAVAIDCDGFKSLNDRYGHDVGDEVLRILARVLSEGTRQGDLVARVGGDEFVLVLDGVQIATANQILRRIQLDFEDSVRQAGYECSISVGVAPMEDGKDVEDLLRTADRAMYVGKEMRRSRAYLN